MNSNIIIETERLILRQYRIEDAQDVVEGLNNLNDEELKLINNRYMFDLTQQETSELMGMSQVQVSRKEKKVLEKIKNRISV